MTLLPGESEQIVADARRAVARHEPELRRLGAVGEVQIGVDPERPTWEQWWARCAVRPRALDPATPLLAEGYKTAAEALGALVDLAARPRLDT